MTTPTLPRSQANRAWAIAATELRLILRNRTVLVSSLMVPLLLGVFWVVTSGGNAPMVLALQLAVTFGMGVYITATQTLVARRHNRVLQRMRTSSISDGWLLVATVVPSVVLGLAQLVIFAVLDVAAGVVPLTDPLALVLAVLSGLALAVTAALATAVITPSPERAQITTLPLMFVLLAAAIVMSMVPLSGWLTALALVPGAAMGQLVALAVTGGPWSALGLPVVASVLWPVLFARFARDRFRWSPRS